MARDLRKYSRQTQNRLIWGFLALVFVLGDGLIFLLWGREAALMGLICLFLGLLPAVLVWVFLALLEWFVRGEREKGG